MVSKTRPSAEKRATWAHGLAAAKTTTMPFLPMLRPISPLSDPVTAQGHAKTGAGKHGVGEPSHDSRRRPMMDERAATKIGRQLSVASNGNHYADLHRQEAERALNGTGGPATPVSAHKESFFSHLRKRARRLSGRNQLPASPNVDDLEASAGCGPWTSNRSSMALDASAGPMSPAYTSDAKDPDGSVATQNARYSVDASSLMSQRQVQAMPGAPVNKKRPQPARPIQQSPSSDSLHTVSATGAAGSSRTRRAAQMSSHPVHRYEAPDEQDELLDEVIHSAHRAVQRLDRNAQLEGESTVRRTTQPAGRSPLSQMGYDVPSHPNPYPTPSPSSKRNSVYFGQSAQVTPSAPIDVQKQTTTASASYLQPKWSTPPYEDNDWAAAAAASVHAAGAAYR
jgi:meiosis induction protein kinase IME2/SME1